MGLFGGTFDPPHVGHVAVATDVADALHLDEVLWVPAGRPPHKPGAVTRSDLRLEMVRAATADEPRFRVEAMEIERDGPSFTVDTVRSVATARPEAELFLIMGADQFRDFGAWREPAGILEHVTLAVMDREGEHAEAWAGSLPGGSAAVFVPVRRVDVSSTEVRARVAEGAPVADLVPAGVRRILERERLYSAS